MAVAAAGDADTRMAPQSDGGSVRAPIGSPPSPPRQSTKRRTTPASTEAPAAVEPVVVASDKAMKLIATDVSGASATSISEAVDPLKLTKGVKALEEVADQSITLARTTKEAVLEHGTRIARAAIRLDVLEKRLTEVEEAHQLSSTKMELNRQGAEQKFSAMVEDANRWEAKLEARLKLNSDDVQAKLKETADTFKACDRILGEIKAMRNTAEHHVGGGIPAAAGPSPAMDAKSLIDSHGQLELLRKRVDDMQIVLNSWSGLHGAVGEIQGVGLNQVSMQISIQEHATTSRPGRTARTPSWRSTCAKRRAAATSSSARRRCGCSRAS